MSEPASEASSRIDVALIEGDRVRLRPVELSEAPVLRPWFDDPDVVRLIGGVPYGLSLVSEEEFIRNSQVNDWEHGVWLGIEATDGAPGDGPRLIGTVALRDLHAESRHAEVGIAIGDRAAWGRGYGTEAMRLICRFGFEELDLHRIELEVDSYNPRAQRSYEKVGFVAEGRLRDRQYAGGRYYDTIVMGLLRCDFEAREAERTAGQEAASA